MRSSTLRSFLYTPRHPVNTSASMVFPPRRFPPSSFAPPPSAHILLVTLAANLATLFRTTLTQLHGPPDSVLVRSTCQAYPQHPCEDPAQLYLRPSSVAYPSRPPPRTTQSLHDARATSQLRDVEMQLYLLRGLPGSGRRVHTTTTSPVQRNAVPSVTSPRAWSSRSSSRAATIAGPRTCLAACLAPLASIATPTPRGTNVRPGSAGTTSTLRFDPGR
jgi:hypothetical protein